MIKEYVVTKKDGRRIRGKMFAPEEISDSEMGAFAYGKKFPLVVFAHGYDSNYRELEHHGPGFAEEGICCFFFDFCGGGRQTLSDGSLLEMTLDTECEDLCAVLDEAKKFPFVNEKRIFLQGESMGGLVAALVAAGRAKEIAGAILWYPGFIIPDDSARRLREGREGTLLGIPINPEYNRKAAGLDVYKEIAAFKKPVLMVHGDQDKLVPICYSERALEVYPDAALIVMEGAGHGFDGDDSAAARNHSIAFIKETAGLSDES